MYIILYIISTDCVIVFTIIIIIIIIILVVQTHLSLGFVFLYLFIFHYHLKKLMYKVYGNINNINYRLSMS